MKFYAKGILLILTFGSLYGAQTKQFKQASDPKFIEITPNAGPQVDHYISPFITADFIYFTTRQDGLGYVYTGIGNGVGNPSRGNVHHIGWDFDPGFKAGVGLNLQHDGWDIYAQYTYLRTAPSDDSTSQPSNSFLFQYWVIGSGTSNLQPTGTFAKATARWNNDFNVIDLELGRNYFISQFLTLRHHVGFKGTWQEQHFHLKELFDIGGNNPLVLWKMKNDMNYWGVGIRTGLNTAWHFVKWFGIYGDLSLSALWSNFDINRKDTRLDSTQESTPITLAYFDNDYRTLKGVIEWDLGLRFDIWWSSDRYHFSLQAGWEEQVWINHNQLIRKNEEAAHGDLIFQGLNVKARIDF